MRKFIQRDNFPDPNLRENICTTWYSVIAIMECLDSIVAKVAMRGIINQTGMSGLRLLL